jgi:hypothetical protein
VQPRIAGQFEIGYQIQDPDLAAKDIVASVPTKNLPNKMKNNQDDGVAKTSMPSVGYYLLSSRKQHLV